jgi:hypothetical protein
MRQGDACQVSAHFLIIVSFLYLRIMVKEEIHVDRLLATEPCPRFLAEPFTVKKLLQQEVHRSLLPS